MILAETLSLITKCDQMSDKVRGLLYDLISYSFHFWKQSPERVCDLVHKKNGPPRGKTDLYKHRKELEA